MGENRFIGLTIGPIYDTLKLARSTGQMWGASYIFSFLMRNIAQELLKRGIPLLVPYLDSEEYLQLFFSEKEGVGTFHDRIIFSSKEGDFQSLEGIVKEVKGNLAELISKSLRGDHEEIQRFVHDYFQIEYIETILSEEELEDKDKGAIRLMNHLLDTRELNKRYVPKQQRNYLLNVLTNQTVKQSFLADHLPPTVLETSQFPKLEDIGENKRNNSKVSTNRKALKYVAYIYADGDNMGNILCELSQVSNEEFKRFSKEVALFDQEVTSKVREFGGFMIYAGGDDLLFLSPLLKGKETVFELIDELDKLFYQRFRSYLTRNGEKPSMSYGVSIAYRKFPMYEALNSANEQLFVHAKSIAGKNSVAIRLLKHSGSELAANLSKGTYTYKNFKDIVGYQSLERNFLRSVQYKIMADCELLSQIVTCEERINCYFANTFDKDIHKDSVNKEYLGTVSKLLVDISKERQTDTAKDRRLVLEEAYSLLKIANFMCEEGDNYDI